MDKDIVKGAKLIRSGQLVAFPTETIYGLGANALDAKAAARIYAAKGRPSDNPLIVHVSDERMLKQIVKQVPPEAKRLIKRFWPGPLTLVLEKKDIPDVVSKLPTVAVRMPDHPVALALIKAAGVPIAAPSANKSGSPSPTSAQHVRDDFPDLFIIDGGDTLHGVESTVVAVLGTPRVLRLGAITIEQLREVIPGISLSADKAAHPESPGMKYRHYAPKQQLIVCANIKEAKAHARKHNGAVILCGSQKIAQLNGFSTIDLGSTNTEIAHNLFKALRTKKGKMLLFVSIPKRGLGRTIMDRVERASGAS